MGVQVVEHRIEISWYNLPGNLNPSIWKCFSSGLYPKILRHSFSFSFFFVNQHQRIGAIAFVTLCSDALTAVEWYVSFTIFYAANEMGEGGPKICLQVSSWTRISLEVMQCETRGYATNESGPAFGRCLCRRCCSLCVVACSALLRAYDLLRVLLWVVFDCSTLLGRRKLIR